MVVRRYLIQRRIRRVKLYRQLPSFPRPKHMMRVVVKASTDVVFSNISEAVTGLGHGLRQKVPRVVCRIPR
jgi:hypothetical protein